MTLNRKDVYRNGRDFIVMDKESYRESVFEYVKNKYKSNIEYLWKRYPGLAGIPS